MIMLFTLYNSIEYQEKFKPFQKKKKKERKRAASSLHIVQPYKESILEALAAKSNDFEQNSFSYRGISSRDRNDVHRRVLSTRRKKKKKRKENALFAFLGRLCASYAAMFRRERQWTSK